MAPLASWYRRNELHNHHEQMIRHALADSAAAEAPIHRNTHVPGDPWRLRGIPVVGVHGGIGGAIPGTKPHSRQW